MSAPLLSLVMPKAPVIADEIVAVLALVVKLEFAASCSVPPLMLTVPSSNVRPARLPIVPLTVIVEAPVAFEPAENTAILFAAVIPFHVPVAAVPAGFRLQFVPLAAPHVPDAVVPALEAVVAPFVSQ